MSIIFGPMLSLKAFDSRFPRKPFAPGRKYDITIIKIPIRINNNSLMDPPRPKRDIKIITIPVIKKVF